MPSPGERVDESTMMRDSVGATTTGIDAPRGGRQCDLNSLSPNGEDPANVIATCVELRRFVSSP
ncbi:MAG: hypothetical protein ABGZ35_22035 [Planctomycetaceae bacterium]